VTLAVRCPVCVLQVFPCQRSSTRRLGFNLETTALHLSHWTLAKDVILADVGSALALPAKLCGHLHRTVLVEMLPSMSTDQWTGHAEQL
jgi:hypothetical protein